MLVFLLLGFAANAAISHIQFFDPTASLTFIKSLGEAGLVMQLFKVGINADLKGLKSQLPNAAWIWLWNVSILKRMAQYSLREPQ
ncbi:MAG: hypothetical protein PHE38_14825 [Alishewanella agri]|nr:hypothetical protein [Alishewanella agri]